MPYNATLLKMVYNQWGEVKHQTVLRSHPLFGWDKLKKKPDGWLSKSVGQNGWKDSR